MNGQLGSPEIAATPPPRSPRAAAVTGRGAAGSRSKQTLKRRPSPWGRGVHGMGGGKMILEEVEGEKRSKETLAQE